VSAAPGPVTLSVETGPLVGPVLARVVGMLAARADLPVDRLDDAVLVADSIAAGAPAHVVDDRVTVRLTCDRRDLELRVGPLRRGGGDALLADAAVPGVGSVVERLVDEVWTEPEEEVEFLHLRLRFAEAG
jgi:serine/threonine-protein kinase RsbW